MNEFMLAEKCGINYSWLCFSLLRSAVMYNHAPSTLNIELAWSPGVWCAGPSCPAVYHLVLRVVAWAVHLFQGVHELLPCEVMISQAGVLKRDAQNFLCYWYSLFVDLIDC